MSNDLLKRANELLDNLLDHDLQYGAQTGAAQIVDDLISAVVASARQLAEQGAPVAAQHRFRHPQKGTPDWSAWQPCEVRNRPAWEIDSQGYEVEYRALCEFAARPLTASPTAPSTEASEPVLKWCNSCGEGVTTFCRAKTPDAERDCPFFDELGEVARTTPPPAPVLSDAERGALMALFNFMQIAFVPMTPQQEEIKKQLDITAAAILGRASRGAK